MTDRTYQTLQALTLLGLGVYFFFQLLSGTLYYYINARFFWLVALAGALFLILGGRALPLGQNPHQHTDHEHGHDHEHPSPAGRRWTLLLVALPLLLGVLLPARPLEASAVQAKGLVLEGALISGGNPIALEQPADQRTILDWIRAFNYSPDPQEFSGETADIVGFVLRDERLGPDEFLLARFTVTCCVADAFAIGVVVQAPNAADLAINSWVHVRGPVSVAELGGSRLPRITAESLTRVQAPPQPYLFP